MFTQTYPTMKRAASIFLLAVIAGFAGAVNGFCEQVSQKEAVAIADLWYAMEINSEHTKLDPAEKSARISSVNNREVLYLVSKDELRDTPPKNGKVFGYIVKYKPNGFVVVSGEDRIDPVLVFNAQGTFRFDRPDRNYMPHYLAAALIGRWEILEERIDYGERPPVHAEWSRLRSRLRECKNLQSVAGFGGGKDGGKSIYVEWDVPTWGQGDPYNRTACWHNNDPNFDIPTGCVATAMAMKMRYHEWPPGGKNTHSYDDVWGKVQYHHDVNYGVHTYDWSDMPMGVINEHHEGVADLMYHCGVGVDMDYEVGLSLAYGKVAPEAMHTYFHYVGHQWNDANHEADMIASIRGGLPVFMTYSGSPAGHAMLATGYRDSGSTHFFVNLGWNGSSNDWYNLDNINGNVINGSAPYSQPTGWAYVRADWTGTQQGTLKYPFKDLAYANSVVYNGGQLWLHEGVHDVNSGGITFTKKLTINAYNGSVLIK